MKKFMKTVAMAVLTIAMMAGFASCANDDLDQAPESVETRAIRFISANTIISTDVTWTSDNTYILLGKVFVKSPATLTIQAGTRVYGTDGITNPANASAVVVTRGAKLVAKGTATNPIIFSAFSGQPGGWGGIVMLGKAPINQPDQLIEGISPSTVPAGVDVYYGGGGAGLGISTDSSGELEYVRVEYAGAALEPDKELNAFTFGGVGSGTVLNHLQAYYGEDDAFEFFGGTVNAKYLVSTATDDDAFDFDFGYRGKIQFAVSTIDPAQTYSSNPNGIECDNDGNGTEAAPKTRPILSNFTISGTQNCSAANALKAGAHFRRATEFTLVNSILYGFPHGVQLEGASTNYIFKNNVVHGCTAPYLGFTGDATNSVVTPETITLTNAWGAYKSTALKPIGGAALNGNYYTHTDSWFTTTNYKGAVDNNPRVNSWLNESWVR